MESNCRIRRTRIADLRPPTADLYALGKRAAVEGATTLPAPEVYAALGPSLLFLGTGIRRLAECRVWLLVIWWERMVGISHG